MSLLFWGVLSSIIASTASGVPDQLSLVGFVLSLPLAYFILKSSAKSCVKEIWIKETLLNEGRFERR